MYYLNIILYMLTFIEKLIFFFLSSGLLKRVHLDSVRLEKKVKKKMMAEGEFYKEKHGLKDYDTTNK